MEYFFYCRDRPDSLDLRLELAPAHWDFMDGYADAMIARGPTLAGDDDPLMTGSMHIVDLPDARAAQSFAFDEPFFKAGLFADVLVRRFRNALGATMWDFTGTGARRYLVIAQGTADAASREQVRDRQREYLLDGDYREALIGYGPLLSEAGTDWLGTALLVESADHGTAEKIVNDSPYAQAGMYEQTEIHNWRFGGRPQPDPATS